MGNCLERAESENGSVIEYDPNTGKTICYHEKSWITHKLDKLFKRRPKYIHIEIPTEQDPYADIE